MRHVVLVGILVAACGPAGRGDGNHGNVDAPGADIDAPPGAVTSRIYAHSGGTLYRMDAATFAVTQVGSMSGLGTQSLTDLAIDKTERITGITLDKLYSVDGANGTVTLIKDLSQSARGFTSLSYVPENLGDPNSADILVSANDMGDVYQIDPVTGNATKIGSYGSSAAGKIVSSGDLIGVRGFGVYATVDVGSQTTDYLASIDPSNGWKATVIGTGTGFDHIFGLGFWNGKIYGFVDGGSGTGGKIVEIDPMTGVGTERSTGSVRWYGAGVSTDAPVIE